MKGSCSKPKSYKKATIDKILTVIGILAILFLIILVLSFFLMLYLTINRFVSNYSLSEGFTVLQPCAQLGYKVMQIVCMGKYVVV